MTEARKPNGQFVTGWSGGPGRPAGLRNKLSEPFLQALANDFREHGQAAIQRVRNERPDRYLAVIASLCPKELHVERSSPLGELSDEELEFLQETLAARQAKLVQQVEGNGKAKLENKITNFCTVPALDISKTGAFCGARHLAPDIANCTVARSFAVLHR